MAPMRPGPRTCSTALLGALALSALALGGCGQGLPEAHTLVQRTAKAMAELKGYHLSGESEALGITTAFQLVALRNGDFSGALEIRVPGAKQFTSRVVATGSKVWVRSPQELAELGITSLPGNLDPSTTWVLQPQAVGASYRRSVRPFVGRGLGSTLAQALRGRLTVSRGRRGHRPVLLVEERGGGSSLRMLVAPRNDRLLQLSIAGRARISLDYSGFGQVGSVAPPPAAEVYVPPAQANPG